MSMTIDKGYYYFDVVELKRCLTTQDCFGLLIGFLIMKSAAFFTPQVLMASGSVGASLCIWVLSGVVALLSAVCYIELGTMIPKSGGEYYYFKEAFGNLPAFILLWTKILVVIPMLISFKAVIFADVALTLIAPLCAEKGSSVRLIAVFFIIFVTVIQCYRVRVSIRLICLAAFIKLVTLLIIILVGFIHLFQGKYEIFVDPFVYRSNEPQDLGKALLSAAVAYSSWNTLHLVTEEIINPHKTLPRVIIPSYLIVTILHVLTNAAFYIVLSPNIILTSTNVALTFGQFVFGCLHWTMAVSEAFTFFGYMNILMFASARIVVVGAKEGQAPLIFGMVNIHRFTPVPSHILLCIISLTFVFCIDWQDLMFQVTYLSNLFNVIVMIAFIVLRITKPDARRPFKVNILIPIFVIIYSLAHFTRSCSVNYCKIMLGILLVMCTIPLYYITIFWENKPNIIPTMIRKSNLFFQKLLLCVPPQNFIYEN